MLASALVPYNHCATGRPTPINLTKQDLVELQVLADDQAWHYEVVVHTMTDGQVGACLVRHDDPLGGPRFGFSRHGDRVLVVCCGLGTSSDSNALYRDLATAIIDVADALFQFLCRAVGVPDHNAAMLTRH